ncbi:hypothetical protein H7H51_21050, partial [Mycolicibacterium farcinogenes]|nr:hypothetical protein [Mycolicibacterium farcinogenes]
MRTASAAYAAAVTTAALILAGCTTEDQKTGEPQADAPKATSPIDWNLPDADRYHRTATYPVHLNKPAEDPVEKET